VSRQNLCPNPAAKNNATGYSGTGTPVRATDFPTPACPRSTGVRTSTAGFLQTPTAACAPGDVFTLSFYGHNGSASDFDFGHTVYIAYTRSSGGDAFPQTQGFTTGAFGTTARFSSPLGVYDFQKRSSLIEVSEAGAQVLGAIAAELAYGEGLQAHARAAELRLK